MTGFALIIECMPLSVHVSVNEQMLRPPVLYSDYVNNFLLSERYKAQGGKKMENVWGCV